MRIAVAQINPKVGDLRSNRDKIGSFIAAAKKQFAEAVVFPECALCGYPPEDLLHKQHFVKENRKFLQTLMKETKGIVCVVGFVDADEKGCIYNAAAVIGDGKLAGIYRKEHLPNYGVFDEKRYFTSGCDNPIFRIGETLTGVSICEDIWHENGSFRWQCKAGVRLLINISSSPFDIGKMELRRKMLSRRAAENKAAVCYVNLVGGQDELVFDGCSSIFSSEGNLLLSADAFEEQLKVVDVPVGEKKEKARKNVPILDVKFTKQKPYAAIASNISSPLDRTERKYKALVLGTQDYVKKNGFKRVVVGLSGGIDSALVASIAVDAIGKENVTGVTMPSQFNSKGTQNDAKKLAANLGIEFLQIPIRPLYEAYIKQLKPNFQKLPVDSTEENIQARIRGNLLMALSNKHGWMVLTTGNKSEMAVGYCTLYGDMSGGFAVIKDIYKTKVYDLANYRNALAGYDLIPQSIIDRVPSAELRKDQKDQDTLPPYGLLDDILQDYIENRLSLKQIVNRRGHPEIVRKVIRMVDASEYKRRQAPPGVKVTQRAFGKDWRLPITNGFKEYIE
jgi:NAD+ synthase (glutamine-hydrolysing)